MYSPSMNDESHGHYQAEEENRDRSIHRRRAALINMAIYRAVEHGLMIEGLHDEEP